MPTFVNGPVEVSVPATSANLGPGFDSLGLALALRDAVTAEVRDEPGVEVTVTGVGEKELPLDESHLVHRAMVHAFEEMGCAVPGLVLRCENHIPHSRGLGSSSAAIVAGICLARALVAGGTLLMDDDAVFNLAARMEGHPDNVAAALYGGFTIAVGDGAGYRAATVAVDPRVRTVVFLPPEPLSTTVARGMLPASVSHDDAAANASRAALLVVALSGRPELLHTATEDFLHQRFRESAMPATLRLVKELRSDGVAAAVSGAGPAVLAFVDESDSSDVRRYLPSGWEAEALAVDGTGVRVAGGS